MTEEALFHGIEAVKPGARVSDIGAAVQQHVEAHGFSVVREFVGHGIGTSLHEEPQIANYGPGGRGPRLSEGMVLAIEPMVNAGKPAVKVLADGWTAVTRDGSLSAHFEHTVVVTRDGCEILTLLDAEAGRGRSSCCRGRSVGEASSRGSPGADLTRCPMPVRDERDGRVTGGRRREAQLPSGLYQVEVDGRADDGARRRRDRAELRRLLVGDRVEVELTPRDLTRGREIVAESIVRKA